MVRDGPDSMACVNESGLPCYGVVRRGRPKHWSTSALKYVYIASAKILACVQHD